MAMAGRMLRAPRSRDSSSRGRFNAPKGQGTPKGQGIPSIPKKAGLTTFRGPTRYSNWAILGKVLQGAYPGSMDDRVHRKQLSLLLKGGVTTFVCLQAEFDPYVSEMEWRRCQKLRPYFGDAVAIVRQSKALAPAQRLPQNADTMQFVYFPIIDQNVAPDADVMLLLEDLYARINKGEVLYVHCWGGHGRAGTVAACLMAMIEGYSPREALLKTQKYHDVRLETSEYRCKIDSPQRPSQRAQVKRLIESWQANHGSPNENNAKTSNTPPMPPSPVGSAGSPPKPAQVRPPPKGPDPRTHGRNTSGGNGIDYNGGVRHSFEGSVVQGYVTPPAQAKQSSMQARGKQTRLFASGKSSPAQASTPSKGTSKVNPSLSLPASYRFPNNNVRVPSSPTNARAPKATPGRYSFPNPAGAKRLSKNPSFSDSKR